MEYENSYFQFRRLSGVSIATSSLRSTRDFLKLSFYIFPYKEISEVFKTKIWLEI